MGRGGEQLTSDKSTKSTPTNNHKTMQTPKKKKDELCGMITQTLDCDANCCFTFRNNSCHWTMGFVAVPCKGLQADGDLTTVTVPSQARYTPCEIHFQLSKLDAR
jgi:hypothetical protein